MKRISSAKRSVFGLIVYALTLILNIGSSFAAQILYGNPNDGGATAQIVPNNAFGTKITVDQPVRLESAGIIFRNFGYHANVGLYSADAEGGLLGTTGVFSVSSIGTMIQPFTTTPLLAPGDYWFVAVFDTVAGIGHSGLANVIDSHLGFPSTLPENLSGFFPYSTGVAYNYYIVASTVPEPSVWLLLSLGIVIAAFRLRHRFGILGR